MTIGLVGAAVALTAGVLVALTAIGQRRRGHGPAVAVVAGVLFPLTWAVWYVRDELLTTGSADL